MTTSEKVFYFLSGSAGWRLLWILLGLKIAIWINRKLRNLELNIPGPGHFGDDKLDSH